MVLARADYTRLLTFRFPCVYIPETDALHSADISTITAESTRTLINSGPNSKMLIHFVDDLLEWRELRKSTPGGQ